MVMCDIWEPNYLDSNPSSLMNSCVTSEKSLHLSESVSASVDVTVVYWADLS